MVILSIARINLKLNAHSRSWDSYEFLTISYCYGFIPYPNPREHKQNVARHCLKRFKKVRILQGTHASHHCTFCGNRMRKTMVPFDRGLCFNCLGGHKSSACQSKYRVLEISLSEMQRETSHEPLHRKPREIAKFSQGSTNLASSYHPITQQLPSSHQFCNW